MKSLTAFARLSVIFVGLLALWQGIITFTGVEHYILPPPMSVLTALVENASLIWDNAQVTALEILLGFVIGCALGIFSALMLQTLKPLRAWLMPVFITTQAMPVFALAPILVLWLGYGMASKVAMAVLIIYFPVTSACYDGLRNTQTQWLDMARTMGASKLKTLWHIQLPAALPALASGLRVAAVSAPIGAIVGEWVGSTSGLGYLMLHSNARMQIDLAFASLFVICLMALAIYFFTDFCLNRLLKWQRAQV